VVIIGSVGRRLAQASIQKPGAQSRLRDVLRPDVAHHQRVRPGGVPDPKEGHLIVTAPAGFGKTALMANVVCGTPEVFAYHFFTSTYVSDHLREDLFLRNVVEQLHSGMVIKACYPLPRTN